MTGTHTSVPESDTGYVTERAEITKTGVFHISTGIIGTVRTQKVQVRKMKFKADTHALHKAISRIEGIISARELRSIISSLLVVAEKDKLILTATDLDVSMRTQLPAEVSETGKIAVPAKKLGQLLRETNVEMVELSSDSQHKIQLTDATGTRGVKISLMGSPAEEFPVTPGVDDKKYRDLPAAVFLDMLRKTSYAAAEDDARYVFNGVYLLNESGKLTMVATDGRRLTRISRDIELPEMEAGIIVPVKAIREITRLLGSSDTGSIAYDKKEHRLHFKIGDVELITKLVDGTFPDYKQVIPKKLDFKVEIDRESLKKSLRQAAVLAAEPTRQVKLQYSPSVVMVSASTPDVGDVNDTLPCDYSGEETTIAFNSNYLLDVINIISSDTVKTGFSTPSAPTVIMDPSDEDFIAVVMPMKI